jgi:hypothetical protein
MESEQRKSASAIDIHVLRLEDAALLLHEPERSASSYWMFHHTTGTRKFEPEIECQHLLSDV